MKDKLFLILTTTSLLVRADEFYSIEEFIFDFGTGLSFASCERYPECSEKMPVFIIVGITIGIVLAILGEKEGGDRFRPRKQAKRIVCGGFGYSFGKSFL